MDFEFLLNRPMREEDLTDLVTQELQANFEKYQHKCFYLKLQKLENEMSQVCWIKTFDDPYEYGGYYHKHEYQQAVIGFRFVEDHYDFICVGHFFFGAVDIWQDKRLMYNTHKCDGNREKKKNYPPEIAARAFAEIHQELKPKRKIAVH